MNLYLTILLVIVVFILLMFLIRQNIKDEKELKNLLNNDYYKSEEKEVDRTS